MRTRRFLRPYPAGSAASRAPSMARASNVPGISGHLRGRTTTTAAAAHHGPLLRRRRWQRRGRPPAHRLPPFDDAEDDTTDVVAADGSAGGYASFVDAGYPSSADAGAKEEEEVVVDEEIAVDSDGAAVPVRHVSGGYAPSPFFPDSNFAGGDDDGPVLPPSAQLQ
ncbi:clathrin light chain 1-like [Hordeum vulgare]|nr:clathrin light chain 1-like [Hordeum vulgare]